MVCEKGEDVLDINIPVVMLPLDAGSSLQKFVDANDTGKFFQLRLLSLYHILSLFVTFSSVLMTVFVQLLCSYIRRNVQQLMWLRSFSGLWLLVPFFVLLIGLPGPLGKKPLSKTSC